MTDQEQLESVMRVHGFRTPPVRYTKKDPRGVEYGIFVVEQQGGLPLSVEKHNPDGCNWKLSFDSWCDFARWAKECT